MELYLPIPRFPNYEASDLGNVRNKLTGFVLKPNLAGRYSAVTLRVGGKSVTRSVHRLVLLAHVGPPPSPTHQGAHGDGDRSNNTLGNLRWATGAENNADKHKHGTMARGERHGSKTHPERVARGERCGAHTHPERRPRGERNGKTTITEADVRAIRTDPRSLRKLAAHYGLTYGTVGKIRRRETWNHVL